MPGLIDKAIQSGSDNPAIYCKRIDRAQWVTGGYHLQATPHELAQTISAIRTHAAPRSMLCLGVESGGVERFLAEELGILSIRFMSVAEPPHEAFLRNSSALEDIGVRKATCDKFDLIVVMGGDFEAAKPFVREGTVVVVLETGMDAGRAKNRGLWHEHRKSQNILLHTHDRGVGVFLVKNLVSMGVKGGDKKGDAEIPDGQPNIPAPDNSDSVNGGPDASGGVAAETPAAPPKRRGRPPKGAK